MVAVSSISFYLVVFKMQNVKYKTGARSIDMYFHFINSQYGSQFFLAQSVSFFSTLIFRLSQVCLQMICFWFSIAAITSNLYKCLFWPYAPNGSLTFGSMLSPIMPKTANDSLAFILFALILFFSSTVWLLLQIGWNDKPRQNYATFDVINFSNWKIGRFADRK